MKPTNIALCLIFIITITFISFYPSIKNEFTNWDDDVYIVKNFEIRNLSIDNIKNFFTKIYFNLYQPLSILTFSVIYHFFKLDPFYYHLINLILHILDSLLVFWLFIILTKKISTSFITSILFAIHPLHVESVAWVTEIRDTLYTLFFLSAIISYLLYHNKNNLKYYYFSLFLFILSLLTKSLAFTIPFVFCLCDYFQSRKLNKNTLIEKIPFFVISFLFVGITIFTITSTRAIEKVLFPYNILSAIYGLVFYITKMFVPINLSCFHPYPANMSLNVLPSSFLLSPVILTGLILFIIFSTKYTKKILFGFLFFLIAILPVLQLLPSSKTIVSERYTYVSLIGLFYITGEGFSWLYFSNKFVRNLSLIILCASIGILSFLTMGRCKVWKNSTTLWSDVLKNYPDIAIAYNNRGNSYYLTGEVNKALADFNKAISIDKNYPFSYTNIGNIYSNNKDYDKAIFYYNKALKISHGNINAYFNRAIAYTHQKKYDKALYDYLGVVELNENHVDAYDSIGNIYKKRNEYDKAIFYYTKALKIDPEIERIYYKRGITYHEKGDYNSAISDFSQTLRINPDNTQIYNDRGITYATKGEYDKALSDFSKAIETNQTYAEAYYNRSITYFKLGEFDSAWKDINKCKSLKHEINPEAIRKLSRDIQKSR